MKKFYFLAMMAMLAMSTTSCQKDDFSDAPVQHTTTYQTTTNSTSTSTSSTTNYTSTPQNLVTYNKAVPGTWTATLADGTVCTLNVSAPENDLQKEDMQATMTIGKTTYPGVFDVDSYGYVHFFSNERDTNDNFVVGMSGKLAEGNQTFRAEMVSHRQNLGAADFSK